MGLDEYTYLGELVDEFNDETADEVNDRIIHMHNQGQLIEGINKRLSRYELSFLLKELKNDNNEFWHLVLRTLIKRYSLNNLKPYLSDSFDNMDIQTETRRLLIFIKIRMVDLIILNKIYKGMDREELKNIFEGIDIPRLMNDVLLFMDNSSLELFLKILIEEAHTDYTDL